MPTTRTRPRRPSKPAAAKSAFDDATWRAAHGTREYVVPGLAYEDYAPAYRYGVLVKDKHGNKEFVEVEPTLAAEWAGVPRGVPAGLGRGPAGRPGRVRGGGAGRKGQGRPLPRGGQNPDQPRQDRDRPGDRPPRTTSPARGRAKAAGKNRTGGDNLRKRGPQDRAGG